MSIFNVPLRRVIESYNLHPPPLRAGRQGGCAGPEGLSIHGPPHDQHRAVSGMQLVV